MRLEPEEIVFSNQRPFVSFFSLKQCRPISSNDFVNMRKAVLIQACENLIKKFDPKRVTLDSHAAEELGDCESADADPGAVFVKQVFYGCVRNKPALKVSKLLNEIHFIFTVVYDP